MTATTGLPLTTPAGGAAVPALQGVPHLSLSVPDLAAAAFLAALDVDGPAAGTH